MFTAQQQSRKQEIIALFAQGTVDDKLFAELKEINKVEQQAKVEREGHVAEIVKGIGELQLTFAELMSQQFGNKPLFASTEIMDYARGHGWKFAGAVNTSAAGTDGNTRQARTKREGVLLFEVQPPGHKGGATKIYKGDKFPAQGIGAKLIWLSQQPGNLADNLMGRAVQSQDVQDYLKTAEGEAEFKKWVNYITEHAPKKPGASKDAAPKDEGKAQAAAANEGDKKQTATAKHK